MAEWTHPRRAAKETISYLSQVEPVIDQFAQDDHSYGGGDGRGEHEDDADDGDVDREQMLDNVLEELKHQTASIMEDRQGSVVAEKIVRRLTPLQLRVMLSRCRGYMLSLGNNRYSSHVLQTLLSVTGQVVEAELSTSDGNDYDHDSAQPNSAEDGSIGKQPVDSMQDIVLSLVAELSGTWAELLADISGSHAGRGFLQVLGGLPILSEKRGRQSRHAHSINTAVAPSAADRSVAGNATGEAKASKTSAVDPESLEKWSTPYKFLVPPSFEAALDDVTNELVMLPAGELQALACGTFGCPLLVMLLRVHGNLKVDAASGKLPCLAAESAAMSIVRKTLEWDNEERSVEVVYAISGENTASHFLEAVLWLSPAPFFQGLYSRCFANKLLEFCEHGVSNFLIQTALQRADDKTLAMEMVRAIGDNASSLLKARRAGVLWRAAQACVRLNLKASTQTQLRDNIARAVQAGHTGMAPPRVAQGEENGHAVAEEGEGGSKGAEISPSDEFQAARAWVPALLSARLPGQGGLDRLFLNVPGARIIQNALLFDPPVAAPVLKAVAALPEAVLAAVARDNMGSRCLLDPILETAGTAQGGGKRKNKPAEDARRTILRSFRGGLIAMACDRIAWHILLKCFRGVDMKEKRAMVEELAGGGEQAWSRMSGYPSGRSVLTECMVERFSRSPHEWEEAFKNRDNREKMLNDIFAVGTPATAGKRDKSGRKIGTDKKPDGDGAVKLAPSPFDAQQTAVSNSAGGETDAAKGKEKRRRQRGRGKRGKSVVEGEAGVAVENNEGGGDNEPGSTKLVSTPAAETPVDTSDVSRPTRNEPTTEESSKIGSPAHTKRKKRGREEGVAVGENGTAGEEGEPPSVSDTVDETVSVEGRAPSSVQKKKKKKKERSAVENSSGMEDVTAVDVEATRVVTTEQGTTSEDAASERKLTESKKKSRRTEPTAEGSPPVSGRKRSLKQNGGVAAVSAEKKRKKASGFRMF